MSGSVIESIELKLAYLERANNELSDVVYRQQQELQELRTRLAVLAGRVDSMRADEPAYAPEQERPPHY